MNSGQLKELKPRAAIKSGFWQNLITAAKVKQQYSNGTFDMHVFITIFCIRQGVGIGWSNDFLSPPLLLDMNTLTL